MNAFKFSAVALALAASFSASAMTSIQDADLAQVSGQDGVSIVADLQINIGSFTYSDNVRDAAGAITSTGSVSFNNININGMMIATIDVIGRPAFSAALGASLAANGANTANPAVIPGIIGGAAASLGYTGGDVIQFAFPVVQDVDAAGVPLATQTGATRLAARAAALSISVESMTTGHGGASMGGIAISKLDMQGTKVWMFGHN
jgi:hypothetical protein